MAEARMPDPARLFFAVAGAIDEVLPRLTEFQAPVAESERYDLSRFTSYYTSEMGSPLSKQLFAFPRVDPARLADIKRRCMELEGPSPRRTNLDPGLVLPSRVILASAKDFSHRVYLRDGIYAEVTLQYRKEAGGFVPLPHTFPDYRSPAVLEFFAHVRRMP